MSLIVARRVSSAGSSLAALTLRGNALRVRSLASGRPGRRHRLAAGASRRRLAAGANIAACRLMRPSSSRDASSARA